MSDEKTKKLKGILKEVKGTKDGKDKDIQIRTKGGNEQEIKMKKSGDEIKSEKQIFEYRVKKDDGSYDDKGWKEFETDVKWTGGLMKKGIEFTNKEIDKTDKVELKETFKPGMGFFGTLTWISWIGIVILIFAIGFLIWWWISSSNKEDKEEESL